LHSGTEGISSAPNPRHLHRRAFLRAATAAAALAPGVGLLSGLLDGQRAAAATLAGGADTTIRTAAGADGGPTSRSLPSVLLGGAEVRPPSVPLAVSSPYLSTWLPATDLTSTVPQFWYGSNRGFAGLIAIDGKVYAWAGQPEINGAAAAPLTQTSLQVTATRSVFTLTAGGVELTAEWLSPIEPDDLKRESLPFTLLTIEVRAIDEASHDVQVYADLTGEWASSDESDVITWDASTTGRNQYWSVQLQTPDPLTEDTQMANWGSAIWGSPLTENQTYQSGYAADVRNQFASAHHLTSANDTDFRAVDDDQPVFAFASDLGAVGGDEGRSVSFVIGHVRTPLISYGADATPILPWWSTYWSHWTGAADFFLADAPAARTRAAALDAKIEGASTYAAGIGYSAITALAARQCYGGFEVAVGPDGQPWVFGKEISSDGDVNSVDIWDQAYLMWLWLDPALIPLWMDPVLAWCASPGWQDESLWADIPSWEDSQTMYCVHDLGVYPVAPGRAPGNGEQMPIEESADMLIMAASYARRVGAEIARPFLRQWQLLWTQWAQYLLTQVPTPTTQLTTDDWAPVYLTPAGGTNLGIKAIIGLAAAGQIAAILGDEANATAWSQAAKDNVEPWVTLSLDPSGNYLNLEQGAAGTWTTVYNAFYEEVIGEKLVPEDVKALQAEFYLTQLEPYGLPLQTDAGDLSKVAWNLYIPAWLRDYPVAAELLGRDVAYVNDTPSLVPYGDRYNTDTGVEVTGVKAHPTLGAVYAVLFAAEPPVVTTLTPAAVPVVLDQAGMVTLANTSASPERLTVTWTAAPPAGSGITVTPASGSATLAPGASDRMPLTVAVASSAAPGTVTVPVSVTAVTSDGTTLLSPGSYLQVTIESPISSTVTPGSLLVAPGGGGSVTLANSSIAAVPLTVQWAAAPPAGSGITVTPASGSAALAAGGSDSASLTVAASSAAAPGTVTVPITVTGVTSDGTTLLSPGSAVQVTIPYPSLAAAFDNVGITDDSDPAPGNFDGYGNSFSATALAAAGLTPGGPVTADGVTFTWPDVPSGKPDNVVASGQIIALSGTGSTLGFLGVANNGIASGTGTITYADGATQPFTIEYQNWITATPVNGDILVATTTYFNRTTKGAARTPSVFAATVPLTAGKTVASVTLPDVSVTAVSTSTVSMHIFAVEIA
jgi:Domain of unknown function (DUF5127)/Domain of unknown function (DUF4965)/Domain of unknown function (DUF1793)/Domain of unknown function (DUF4964)